MNWKSIVAVGALLVLGVMLFFSASAFFNMVLIPRVVHALSADDVIGAKTFIVFISVISALIAAFFSVFLFEMISNWRPWLSGFLFALPVMLSLSLFAGISGGLTLDVLLLYVLQFIGILLAYWLMSFLGRGVGRRFFAPVISVEGNNK